MQCSFITTPEAPKRAQICIHITPSDFDRVDVTIIANTIDEAFARLDKELAIYVRARLIGSE